MTTDRYAFRFDMGAVWLNLLATTGRTFSTDPIERMDTVERLSEWLERSELTPAVMPDKSDLARARELREILRTLALATVDDRPPPPDAVGALTAYLREEAVVIKAGTRLRREPPPTVSHALSRIARQAAEHLSGPDRLGLKCCPEHDCRGVFLDPSDRRRWCPSPSCASRGRVRALRARRSTIAADDGAHN